MNMTATANSVAEAEAAAKSAEAAAAAAAAVAAELESRHNAEQARLKEKHILDVQAMTGELSMLREDEIFRIDHYLGKVRDLGRSSQDLAEIQLGSKPKRSRSRAGSRDSERFQGRLDTTSLLRIQTIASPQFRRSW